jgi:metallo-beta-lactamase family protein
MLVKISFFGAAHNVTGSRYLLEACGQRVLVDCGIHQERELRQRDWDPFPVDPASIDAVVLTHAHLDHCGFIPRLCKLGFAGPVYATPASAEIAKIVMADCGRLQEEDADKKARRHAKHDKTSPFPIVPLYTEADARRASERFQPVPYGREFALGGGLTAVFRNAGHIFGSSILRFVASANGASRTVLFSGDVGRSDKPILNDPSFFDTADYVVVESTYGDRIHGAVANIEDEIAHEINDTCRRGGNVVVPTFAVERAHELLYYLNELLQAHRIPELPAFLDSPMAIEVTKVFERHAELYDAEMVRYVKSGQSPFKFPGLRMTTAAEESKAINDVKGTAIIMAGSGMCTGGRVKHHLRHNISRPECTIMFVGYQGQGTLGREITEGAEEVRIFGQFYRVKARIARVHGFSGHADREELLAWVAHAKGIKRAIVTHGEASAATSFAALIRERLGVEAVAPGYGQSLVLD